MYLERTIAVVIPTYNEETFIAQSISKVPLFVDWIIVVNDASKDNSLEAITKVKTKKVEIVSHQNNLGVGAATISGYRKALTLGADVVVVMDGDGQMDAKDLPTLLNTLIINNYDYVKGNRFLDKSINTMPKSRYLGNIVFSYLMRISLSLTFSIDSQCGYTAITNQAIKEIDLEKLYPRYGFLNSLLFSLVEKRLSIGVTPVQTIYGKEKSGINPFVTVPTIFFIILFGYFKLSFSHYFGKNLLPEKNHYPNWISYK